MRVTCRRVRRGVVWGSVGVAGATAAVTLALVLDGDEPRRTSSQAPRSPNAPTRDEGFRVAQRDGVTAWSRRTARGDFELVVDGRRARVPASGWPFEVT